MNQICGASLYSFTCILTPTCFAFSAKTDTSGFNMSFVPVKITIFCNLDKSPSIGFTK